MLRASIVLFHLVSRLSEVFFLVCLFVSESYAVPGWALRRAHAGRGAAADAGRRTGKKLQKVDNARTRGTSVFVGRSLCPAVFLFLIARG